MLNLLIAIPIVAAIAVLLGAPARRTALLASALNFILTLLVLFGYNQAKGGYQFQSSVSLVPEWHLAFYLGVDGLGILMLLLTVVVAVAAIWVAPPPEKIERAPNLYYASLLFIAAGATGAFASLDLFFFYAFHELALIPTFLLIGIWGTGDRAGAAWKITIYLALGSFVLLVGLTGLYTSIPADSRTFDIVRLQEMARTGAIHAPPWVYLCTMLGFGVLVSLFPFHTWAPQAYASAPTPATMLHAGVLKKFGLYGLLRVALPLMPQAAHSWNTLLLALLAGNILYVGLVTISQKRLDSMLGYSSVMHMGYIFLGLASMNLIGVTGAALLMFAHGLSIAALFAIAGNIRQKTGTLEFSQLGGLATPLPFLGFAFGLAAFAAIGLPGFGNFAAELMVFFGAFKNGGPGLAFSDFQIVTVVALWGVVISAVYMLRAYRAVFMGETPARWAGLSDCCRCSSENSCCIRPAIALLLALLLVAGFQPQLFVNLVRPAILPAVTHAVLSK